MKKKKQFWFHPDYKGRIALSLSNNVNDRYIVEVAVPCVRERRPAPGPPLHLRQPGWGGGAGEGGRAVRAGRRGGGPGGGPAPPPHARPAGPAPRTPLPSQRTGQQFSIDF